MGAVGTWTRLKNTPNFSAANHLLLTDGTVICQDLENNVWWRLTPDANGSYINGTWSRIADAPSDYGPLWYSSAVLPSGNVIVIGGEYNLGSSEIWTNLGAYYNASTNTWTPVTPPDNGQGIWANIGDAQSIVLPDGRFILGNPFGTAMAAFNESTLDFTDVNTTGKVDRLDEEGWTLLPDGSILTVDAIKSPGAERYIPTSDTSGSWVSAGSTPNSLEDATTQELGPMVLRYDGTVFATGATKYNAIYNVSTGAWTAGPDFPSGLDIADGPCCLLPNDHVLVATSPGVFNTPVTFLEFDGTKWINAPNFPNASGDSSFQVMLLMLPTGQVMATDFSNDVEIYTPDGTYQSAWKPMVTNVAANVSAGQRNVTLQGMQLNGLSQCNAYGDDQQAATNYPIVRITNNATKHVFYCKTHDHSTMAVATGSAIVSTFFDVPKNIETGTSTLEVIANGIPSNGVPITVGNNFLDHLTSIAQLEGTGTTGSVSATYKQDGIGFNVQSVHEGTTGQVASAVGIFTIPKGTILSAPEIDFTRSAPTGATNFTYLWNWVTNKWVPFGTLGANGTYQRSSITMSLSQFSSYENSAGQVKILFRAVFPQHLTSAPPPFLMSVDLAQFGLF